MAKTTKKQHVSVNELDKFIFTPSEFIIRLPGDEPQTEVVVKPRLTLAESLDFVNSVISDIFDEESGFSYYFKDFSIRINTLKYFTNITVPQNLEKQYNLVYTDLLDRIFSEGTFDNDTYKTLLDSLDKQIEFEKEKYLCELRAETRELIDSTAAQIEDLMKVFQEFGKVFDKVNPDQMSDLVTKLAGMKQIDEGTLAKAVLDVQNEKAETLSSIE